MDVNAKFAASYFEMQCARGGRKRANTHRLPAVIAVFPAMSRLPGNNHEIG
jgi:hypothetical protein